jgi:hypothetical protein
VYLTGCSFAHCGGHGCVLLSEGLISVIARSPALLLPHSLSAPEPF